MDIFKIALFIVLCAISIAAVVLLIVNMKKSSVKREMDELNVQFNEITTIPLAFKLNKAQSIAKRIDDSKEKVDEYYEKYKEAQKGIDQLGAFFDEAEEAFNAKKYNQARNALDQIRQHIDESREEVANIDKFLDSFSQKETEQREFSAKLKEQFREIKMTINEKSNYLSIGYEGIEKKLENCEDLFSQSEEYMYAGDYGKAQDVLEKISESMATIKHSCNAIPELVKDAKGVIPILFDEANRQYALARQRGAFLSHLDIDNRLKNVQALLNDSIKAIISCDVLNVKQTLDKCKSELNDILNGIEKENNDHENAKKEASNIENLLEEARKLHNYVETSYSKDKERFDLGDVETYLNQSIKEINNYARQHGKLLKQVEENSSSASESKEKLDELVKKTNEIKDKLASYKQLIDKNTSDEERAKTQLIKLQVVLNEVEVKVKEYHMPTISDSYQEDLKSGRERILRIRRLLQEIPLDINELNSTLDEAIDYIYTFYNNANNVVGMAIMVENAIVFGNKYRSTYPEIDRDLSKAEFSYLNGEYTKALTMSISSMETLFPNNVNEKILENN